MTSFITLLLCTPFKPSMEDYFLPSFFLHLLILICMQLFLSVRTYSRLWQLIFICMHIILSENLFLFMIICKNLFFCLWSSVRICENLFLSLRISSYLWSFCVTPHQIYYNFLSAYTYFYLWESLLIKNHSWSHK